MGEVVGLAGNVYCDAKSCPFCDSERLKTDSRVRIGRSMVFWIQCRKCSASGPHARLTKPTPPVLGDLNLASYETTFAAFYRRGERRALTQWNRGPGVGK